MNKLLAQPAIAAFAALSFCLANSATAQSPEGRVYQPGPFDSIEISGSAVVNFVQGNADQVLVEGDEAVQKAVDLEVRNGKLSLRSGGSWKFWNARRLHVSVTARTLRRISISGAADLNAAAPVQAEKLSIDISGAGSARFDQLKAEQLNFQVSGAGDGRFAGSVHEVNIEVSGKGNLDAGNLQSERARVAISGIGDVAVWARQDLSVSIAGIGTVDYWGSPNIKRSISGKGTLNDRGAKRPAP